MRTPAALLFAALLSTCVPAHAHADAELDAIDRYVRGRRLAVSYREGGPVYGTHVFLDITYCQDGTYTLSGQSRRQTVLDNWQVNNWQDLGRWEAIRVQEQPGVRYVSSSSETTFVPVHVLPDGRLSAGPGVSVQVLGPADCR